MTAKHVDIPYVQNGTPKQCLDLYIPAGKDFATVLFVHGGSLTSGDRKDKPYPAIAEAFQKAGLGCAIMSYRLANQQPWPAQPQDVASAVAWLKSNLAKHGGDPGKVVLVGHSSGGHLVALVSCEEKYLKDAGLSLKDIAGTVPMGTLLKPQQSLEAIKERFNKTPAFKMFGTPEAYYDAWPRQHLGKHIPPMLMLIAEAERFQPPILADTEEFVAEAKKLGAQADYEVLKDRTHMSTILKMPEAEDATLARVVRFVREVTGKK